MDSVVHIAALALSVLLALAMLVSGTLKLFPTPRIVRLMEAVHVGGRLLAVLGGLQIAATVGLIVGIWAPPLAIAAATGLVLYFCGAIGAHLRAGDPDWRAAAMFLVLSVTTLVLLVLDA